MIGLSRDQDHVYTAAYPEPIVVPGVTGILRVLDKPALIPWAQGIVAEAAIRNRASLDEWVQLGGEAGAVKLLKSSAETQRDKAAATGSEVHALAEAIVRGLPVVIPEALSPFVSAYQEFLARFEPEFLAVEEMVFSGKGYAGTFDAIAVIAGETWLLDIKTSKGTYSDTALQLAAYGFADFIGRPGDANQYAIPTIDQFGVIHVRPEGAELIPYDVTADDYDAFLNALGLHRWRTGKAKNVMQQAIGPALLNFGRKAS